MEHKENITLTQVCSPSSLIPTHDMSLQIKQNVEMESMQEKLHQMIIQSKIDETKDHMRKMARKLDQEKIEKAKLKKSGFAAASYPVPSTYNETMGVSPEFEADQI